MSALEGRLRAAVADYIGNRITAADLDGITGELLYAAADASDGSALDLASTIALRLSEYWDGAWTEHEVRAHLEPLADAFTMFAAPDWPEIGLVTPMYSMSAAGAQTLFATAFV